MTLVAELSEALHRARALYIRSLTVKERADLDEAEACLRTWDNVGYGPKPAEIIEQCLKRVIGATHKLRQLEEAHGKIFDAVVRGEMDP